ncbi:MAG TPA: AIR synthase family protein [Candidatus Eubacterium avistercoris]|uniref:AIR synthase family protein n=1 Tax=Candidatus Eubacterium avistercoris TaxID=2838567 RepID=A0A9D2D541_9FIRM|nr:AIR synthase family protein [Candidatus Eubacterium avistercoris]
MNIGKLPENVLKRSVFKQLHTKRKEVLQGAGVGEDCAAMLLGADEMFVVSTDPITGTTQDIGRMGMLVTLNDLASAGAEPVGVLLTALLPENITEPQIRQIMQQIDGECEKYHVQVMGGHTEITRAVNQPVLTVTGIGKALKGKMISTGGARPGDDMVITKWIAIEGTVILAKEKEMELLDRFPKNMIEEAKKMEKYLSVVPEAAVAVRSGVSAMHDVTEGGIFGALWEMAEASGVGLEIDLKKIPVRQESIEICEYFGINPYELISSGSMLIAASDGNMLVRNLEKEGIPAAVVGKAMEGNDRILINDGEVRFLEPPKTDELYKVLN